MTRTFQPTLPRGERPIPQYKEAAEIIFQPTLPRGERPATSQQTEKTIEISTHAPAWGATLLSRHLFHHYYISTHAPAWGATSSGGAGLFGGQDFNPRSRVGSDAYGWMGASVFSLFQPTLPRGERRLQRGIFGK